MFNPYNERDLARLKTAAAFSSKKWSDHLTRRLTFMREVAGFHYGPLNENAQDHVVLPLLGLAVKVFSRLIASSNPRASIEHWNPDFDSVCYELKLALDDEFQRINIAQALNAVTVESFFLMGVCKVGRVDVGTPEEVGGYTHNVGTIFADQVLNEDFIFDMRCTRWERIGFCGDMSRVPLDWAKSNKEYDRKGRERLTTANEYSGLPFGGKSRRLKSQLLSNGQTAPAQEDYEDQTEVWNLWFPRERHVLTIDRNFDVVLQWKPWDGPDHGMYHILGYNHLPGNLVPLPPLAEWMDQHLYANRMANKVVELAINSKTVLANTGKHGREDAETVINTPHMGAAFLNDLNSVKEIRFNGPDQGLWGMATILKDNFAYFCGNLDAVGGLGPQSPTVGQDRLLAESSNRQVQSMQEDVTKLAEGVMTDYAWYMRNDPKWKRQLVKNIEYAGLRIPFEFTPAEMPGEFADYRIRVEPYSLAPRTPQQRLAMLSERLKTDVMQMLPYMENAGVTLNFERLFKKIAEYSDLPELSDILMYLNGEQERPAGRSNAGRNSNKTHTQIRVNRSTKTRSSNDNTLARAAFGDNPQRKERAMVGS